LSASRLIVWFGALIVVGLLFGQTVPAAARDCSSAGIAKTRAEFKQAYDKKDFEGADAIMTSLWNDCVAHNDIDIDPVLRARLSNDIAILAHRRDDDDSCLQALLEYIPTKRANSAFAKLPPDLQSAIRFNFELCRPYCATHGGPDASCESISASAELDQLVEGGFAEKPCPFDTGGSPTVALPDGACLTVFAPLPWFYAKDSNEDDPAQQDPEKVCPRVALARMANGKLALTPLAVPKKSMLRSLDACCSAIDLAINAKGQIELTPSENPPENCISGHRWNALQDIFVVQGSRLSLIHRLDFGN
jgi:hypothetical protein